MIRYAALISLLLTSACTTTPGKFRSAVYSAFVEFTPVNKTVTSTSSDIDPPNNGGIACFHGTCKDLTDEQARRLVLDEERPGQELTATYMFASVNTTGKDIEGFELKFITSERLFAITLSFLWNNKEIIRGMPSSGDFDIVGQQFNTTQRNKEKQLWATPGASMLLVGYTLNPEWGWFSQVSAELWGGIGYGLQISLLTKDASFNVEGDLVDDGGFRAEIPYGIDTALHSVTFDWDLMVRAGPFMMSCQFLVNGQLGAMTSCSLGGRLRFE